METDRTIWGARTRIAAVMVPSVLLLGAANLLVLERIGFPGPRTIVAAVGVLGVVAGLGTIVASYRALKNALERGDLCTDGPYRVVRHPLYAAWIWLLLPGVSLFFDLPLLLLTSPLMFLVTLQSVSREEAILEAAFGEEYEAYRDEVNALVPTLGRR